MVGVDLSTCVCEGHVVVALCGELDYVYAVDAEAAIAAPTARGQSLIIDMSALDFIDCSSLSVLPVRGTLSGGTRWALHALGGQRHCVLTPGDRGLDIGGPGEPPGGVPAGRFLARSLRGPVPG